MDSSLQTITDQQKQSWNKFSGGWKKWDAVNMDFINPMGKAIIGAIAPAGNQYILDIASGTGEPALTIASMLSGGKVMMTDVAEDMLSIASDNATARNISNTETLVCDVCELPFADNIFDAISCRFGFMFFADMQLATNEMYRVLKLGGKVATSVWNVPPKNFWVTAIMGVINKHIEPTPPPPGAPGMFRCSQPGLMKGLFENAGFTNYKEEEVASKLKVMTLERYWEMLTEVGAPIVAALSKADDALRQKIKKEVFDVVSEKYPDGEVMIDASALIVSGQKA